MLVGIAGKKGVGKSTVGTALEAHGFVRQSFAATIKFVARIILRYAGLDEQALVAAEFDKEALLPVVGFSYRRLLQVLGTEVGRALHPDLWVMCASHAVADSVDNVFDDIRFENEAAFIRTQGGLVIHITRTGGADDNHVSEAGIAVLPGDVVIVNDGSVEELALKAFDAVTAKWH